MSTGYPITLGSSAAFLNEVQDSYPGSSDSFITSQYPGMLGRQITLSNDEALALSNLSGTDYTSSTPLKGGTYQYVKMAASVTIAAARGLAVYWKAGSDGTFTVTTDAPTGGNQFAGILINALAVGKYGWILVSGEGYIKGKASSLTNTGAVGQLMSVVAAAGTWDNALPANLTDSTGGTVSTALASTVGVSTIALYVNLADLANADLLTTYTLGYKFKILGVNFAVEKAVTTGAKAATLTPKISGVAVTGGVLSLTSANCTPQGTVVAGSAVTALNTGSAAATISITGSAVTTFVEGAGWILLTIQNMDVADAFASIANMASQLRAALLQRVIAYETPVAGSLKLAYISGMVPSFSPGVQ